MEGANQLWSEVFHTRGENYNTFLDVTLCCFLPLLIFVYKKTGDNEGGDRGWEWRLRISKSMNEQSPYKGLAKSPTEQDYFQPMSL